MIHRKYQPSFLGLMIEAGEYNNLIQAQDNLYTPPPPYKKKQ